VQRLTNRPAVVRVKRLVEPLACEHLFDRVAQNARDVAADGAQCRGLVVNVLSTVCLYSNEGIGGYTASKCAFDGLAKVLRKELRADGVRVANVYPGGIDTPFRPAARPEYLAAASVAEAILGLAEADENVAPDELVLRPLVERNFA